MSELDGERIDVNGDVSDAVVAVTVVAMDVVSVDVTIATADERSVDEDDFGKTDMAVDEPDLRLASEGPVVMVTLLVAMATKLVSVGDIAL